MEKLVNVSINFFGDYIKSFKGLSEDQKVNFDIKREHSIRVAEVSRWLSGKLKLEEEDEQVAYLAGLYHDIGRFSQLVEFNTFLDSESVDHAERSVQVLKDNDALKEMDEDLQELVYSAVQHHNKFELPKKLSEQEMLHGKLLRDADKLDIFKVLTDYYSVRNQKPNHTLTWELPKGTLVSPAVAKEILAGKLVSKKEVKSEIDVKIMQLSWVYDLNFRASFDYLIENRFLEKIYNTLSKNDVNIEIYRKVKVYSENKMMG